MKYDRMLTTPYARTLDNSDVLICTCVRLREYTQINNNQHTIKIDLNKKKMKASEKYI